MVEMTRLALIHMHEFSFSYRIAAQFHSAHSLIEAERSPV